MSVASDAAHARVGRAGRAEQMARSATGALASFAVVQRVGAGDQVLEVAEQLLVAALAEVRGVRRDLAAAPPADDDPGAGASAAPAPRPSAPAAPAAASVVILSPPVDAPQAFYRTGPGSAATRPRPGPPPITSGARFP